jgi:predicted TIM-barrel fold metal-dependent hydrolase
VSAWLVAIEFTDANGAKWLRDPLSENDRRKICYGNAAALFGLPR